MSKKKDYRVVLAWSTLCFLPLNVAISFCFNEIIHLTHVFLLVIETYKHSRNKPLNPLALRRHCWPLSYYATQQCNTNAV